MWRTLWAFIPMGPGISGAQIGARKGCKSRRSPRKWRGMALCMMLSLSSAVRDQIASFFRSGRGRGLDDSSLASPKLQDTARNGLSRRSEFSGITSDRASPRL